jgi:hypothetical protein
MNEDKNGCGYDTAYEAKAGSFTANQVSNDASTTISFCWCDSCVRERAAKSAMEGALAEQKALRQEVKALRAENSNLRETMRVVSIGMAMERDELTIRAQRLGYWIQDLGFDPRT